MNVDLTPKGSGDEQHRGDAVQDRGMERVYAVDYIEEEGTRRQGIDRAN